MRHKVRILPPDVVAKIAAGEVIERPASVVKELLENALDAGADDIRVDIQKAGKTAITVRDNGSGIAQDDMPTIFARHATSKINTVEDLFDIHSLGFRGEALYSIAAVSDVVLRSRPEGQPAGFEMHYRGGKKIHSKPVSTNRGTAVEIRELFFNTPARKKFLKADQTELNRILEVVIPYMILNSRCRFVVTHNGKTLFDLRPDSDRIQRLAQVLNTDAKDILNARERLTEENLGIEILMGNINIQRARRDQQFIFVNGRPVQHRGLAFHVNQKYRLIFPPDAYPMFALFLNIPVERVDVNTHPAKREVKIKGEESMVRLLRGMVERTLIERGDPRRAATIFEIETGQTCPTGPVGQVWPEEREFHTKGGLKQSDYRIPSDPHPANSRLTPEQQETIAGMNIGSRIRERQEDFVARSRQTLKEKLVNARFIGGFLNKYLLFESGRSLLLVDQHAAQERIVFEALLRQMNENRVEAQNLLEPVTVTLSPQELLVWDELKDKLEAMGFSYTMFAKDTVAIQSYPQLIKNPALAVRYILAGEEVAAIDNETLARRACRKSVMAGDALKPEQADYQRGQLLKCADPFTCPHGRPTLIEIEEERLDKQFLRK